MTNDNRSDGGQIISAPTCTNVTLVGRVRFAVTKIRDFDGYRMGVVTQIRDLDNTPTTHVSFRGVSNLYVVTSCRRRGGYYPPENRTMRYYLTYSHKLPERGKNNA